MHILYIWEASCVLFCLFLICQVINNQSLELWEVKKKSLMKNFTWDKHGRMKRRRENFKKEKWYVKTKQKYSFKQ